MPRLTVISRRPASITGLLAGLLGESHRTIESREDLPGALDALRESPPPEVVVLDAVTVPLPSPRKRRALRSALGETPLVTIVPGDHPGVIRRFSFPFSQGLLFDPFDLDQIQATFAAVTQSLTSPARADTESLDALAIFLRGVSNEVLNPLTSISGIVQVLLHEEDKGSEKARRFEMLLQSVERIQNTLRELELFVRGRKPQRQVLRLDDLLGELQKNLRGETPPVELGLKLLATSAAILGDRTQLLVALGHLARFAAGTRALVEVELRRGGQNELVVLLNGLEPVSLPERPERMFFPYHHVPGDSGPGNLQLAAAYGIVRSHRGRLELRKGDGGEARFSLKFPLGPPLNSAGSV